MGIIRAVNLIFDYIRHDEETDKDEVSHALRGVNLDIEEGSFVAILGHNGSGKSTFAKLMNGILLPSDGTVYISDMKTSDEEHLWDVRKTAGMVFQNPDNQIIGNVVEEDVGFGPENMGVPTDEIWKRVDRSLEAVGMTAYRLQSPNKLSGGQKQRVAIAGVMAMTPAMATRCFWPPESLLGDWRRYAVIPTASRLRSTRFQISSVGTPIFSGPKPTSSSTTLPMIWLSGFWNTIPAVFLTSQRCSSSLVFMSEI